MPSEPRERILVICPVYNEEANVQHFFERMRRVFDQVDRERYECRLLFTNNRSTDQTLELVRGLHLAFDWVDYLTMSRNHGYQRSVLAGLSCLEADLYMICDVDCEDPPELLTTFLGRIEKGADHVYGVRTDRPEPWLMRKARGAFYLILSSIGDNRIIPYMAEFALFRRCVRDVLVANWNGFPFLRAEVGYAGFAIVGVPYRREPRRFGRTHYDVVGNARFAVAGMLSSTTFPLRLMLYALPGVFVANALALLLWMLRWVAFEATVVGMLAFNLTYLASGVAFGAVYLARTYQNGLFRQRFIVDWAQSSLASPDAGSPPKRGAGSSSPALTRGTVAER